MLTEKQTPRQSVRPEGRRHRDSESHPRGRGTSRRIHCEQGRVTVNDPTGVVLFFAAAGVMGCLTLIVLGYIREE